MTVFELWVDESGDFEKDREGVESPSLVGGILFKKGTLTENSANLLLNKIKEKNQLSGWVHGTSIPRQKYGSFATDLLSEVHSKEVQLIIFENEERLKIVNGDLTYLNILSEGLIQLIQTLSINHDELELQIVAANRQKREGTKERREIVLIQDSEYVSRLKERVSLGFARRNIINSNWKWTFERKSARKDPRLMIADVVCHSWFRKNGAKFNHDQRDYLLELFNPLYCFTVFEQASFSSVKRLLSEGAIGSAIFEWVISLDNSVSVSANKELVKQKQKEMLKLIFNRMSKLADLALRNQLMQLIHHIQSLIEIDRDFTKAKKILENLQKHIIPEMISANINSHAFFFHIYFLLLEIANHQGDIIQADKLLKESHKLIPQLASRWENMDDVLEFLVREAVHKSNLYDFNSSIQIMNQVQNLIDGTFELFPIGFKDELSVTTSGITSNILGKVAGTRLQARIFMGRENEKELIKARRDSELSISQFQEMDNVNRQYQYRSQLECEAGNFTQSLEWLGRSFGFMKQEEITPKMLIKKMTEASKTPFIFGCMHYTRLMAGATWKGKLDFADKLYDEWVKGLIEQKLFEEEATDHPYEIILWKVGSYLLLRNRIAAGNEKFGEAIKICTLNKGHLTLQTIGLGIAMERAGLLLKAGKRYKTESKKAIREAINIYEFITNVSDLPIEFQHYLFEWKEPLSTLDQLGEKMKSDVLLGLSRKVPY